MRGQRTDKSADNGSASALDSAGDHLAADELAADHLATGATPTRALLMQLQRRVGNDAVAGLLGRSNHAGLHLQRTVLTVDAPDETLYNQTPDVNPAIPAGTVGGETYGSGGSVNFDMTRTDSPSQARIEVRIKFVNQDRDTQRTLPDGTDNPNYMGHVGAPTAIPAGDERRAYAEGLCTSLGGNWNGKMKLVGTQTPPAPPADPVAGVPPAPAPVPVQLPIVFVATPVWDVAADANEQIRLFGTATRADAAAGHPIDAGNYYMNMGDYGGTQETTFAHEYGHLLGLNDEYSQSNAQMHALLHQVSPTLGGARGQALDRATVKRMVLAALTSPLMARVRSASRQMAAAFSAVRAPMSERLSESLKSAAIGPGVRTPLTELLSLETTGGVPTAAAARVAAKIPTVVNFQTGPNFSNRSIAGSAVAGTFDAGALNDVVANAYFAALMDPHSQRVSVGGGASGDISIDIAGGPARGGSGVWGALKRGTPGAGDASGVADAMVGPTGARVPPVAPPDSLLAKIEAIPSAWTPDYIAAFIHSAKTEELMTAAFASASAAGDGGAIGSLAALYRRALTLVGNAANAAAQTQVQDMLMMDLDPMITENVNALQTEINGAVEQVMNTPAGAVAAAAPPDPAMLAIVTAMQARLAAQAPAQTAGRTHSQPTLDAAGAEVASQEITYSNSGMMSDNSEDVRPDQFARIAAAFSAQQPALRHADESDFTAERQ